MLYGWRGVLGSSLGAYKAFYAARQSRAQGFRAGGFWKLRAFAASRS